MLSEFEKRIWALEKRIGQIDAAHLSNRISKLSKDVHTRFDETNGRIDETEERLDAIDKRMATRELNVSGNIIALIKRVDDLEVTVTAQDVRLDRQYSGEIERFEEDLRKTIDLVEKNKNRLDGQISDIRNLYNTGSARGKHIKELEEDISKLTHRVEIDFQADVQAVKDLEGCHTRRINALEALTTDYAEAREDQRLLGIRINTLENVSNVLGERIDASHSRIDKANKRISDDKKSHGPHHNKIEKDLRHLFKRMATSDLRVNALEADASQEVSVSPESFKTEKSDAEKPKTVDMVALWAECLENYPEGESKSPRPGPMYVQSSVTHAIKMMEKLQKIEKTDEESAHACPKNTACTDEVPGPIYVQSSVHVGDGAKTTYAIDSQRYGKYTDLVALGGRVADNDLLESSLRRAAQEALKATLPRWIGLNESRPLSSVGCGTHGPHGRYKNLIALAERIAGNDGLGLDLRQAAQKALDVAKGDVFHRIIKDTPEWKPLHKPKDEVTP